MTSYATRASGGRRYLSRNAASRRGRRLRRWNRDRPALKNAFQLRDASGDIAFPAVFQRHSGVQGPGITVRVEAVIIRRRAAGTGPWCPRLMPVREECARAKAKPSRAILHRRKGDRPRQARHTQLQRLRSTALPLRGGSSTARRRSLALRESTSSFCLHPGLEMRWGMEPRLELHGEVAHPVVLNDLGPVPSQTL